MFLEGGGEVLVMSRIFFSRDLLLGVYIGVRTSEVLKPGCCNVQTAVMCWL